MDRNDPTLIITLVAVNAAAERAWNREENRERCELACTFDDGDLSIPSREPTPAGPEQDASKIHLTFNKKPKNLEKGFLFGSDPKTCDVLLGTWAAGFTRQHFQIKFNERGDVILTDVSRGVTCVSYDGEDPPRRNQFTWILFSECKKIEVTLNKAKIEDKSRGGNELVFKVEWPNNREFCPAQYEVRLHAYLEECRKATPSLSPLGMDPRKQPIYLTKEELGRGAFGTVHRVVDVSTGCEYAGKTFLRGEWRSEVGLLRTISHKHIAEFVDFSEEQQPMLVMGYLPFGNLRRQGYINKEQTLQVLFQGLQALEYLHSRSPPLVHRDIKPENILVQSLKPFLIKLADFGLAKNDSTFMTLCGTDLYMAPEMWDHFYYTPLVDIWSLGVVIYKYGYKRSYKLLPKLSRKNEWSKARPSYRKWCEDIAEAAENEEGKGDALVDLISTKMLRMNYQDRYSASDCLGEVYRLGFHSVQNIEIGHSSPTGNRTDQDGVRSSKPILNQRRHNIASDSNIPSEPDDERGGSETTEIAPSKRGIRPRVHFYNRASSRSHGRYSQGPSQTQEQETEDVATSTQTKRQWPQPNHSPTVDTVGKGQSKRMRASIQQLASLRSPVIAGAIPVVAQDIESLS